VRPFTGRRAGVLVPLFSLRTERGWGVGEIPDIVPAAEWLADAGHGVLQLLPIVDPAAGQESPYFAQTAFGIDGLYLALDEVEDLAAAGGAGRVLGPDGLEALARARAAARVDHGTVRSLKARALEAAFRRFLETEWRGKSGRAAALEEFRARHEAWLDDYALFRVLKERAGGAHWREWPAPLRDRDPAALARVRREALERFLFHVYVQWQAEEQWERARGRAAALGVRLKGDLPFVVAWDSADVWERPHEFRHDASLGAPPDAFSADGQDWDLPVYRFDVMGRTGDEWFRERGRRASELYDLVRVDHVVGLYRQWTCPRGAGARHGRFVPEAEAEQVLLGERILRALAGSGDAELIAEDLGVVPDFVRASLTRLGIPGYRVFRWEADRDFRAGGRPVYRDPARYPALSVATTGTHDNEPLAEWWEALDAETRRAVLAIPGLGGLRERHGGDAGAAAPALARFSPEVHDAVLGLLYASGSGLVVLPVQDVLGSRERVNTPATVGPQNWTYRLPATLAELRGREPWRSRAAALRELAARTGRLAMRP